MSEAAGAGFLDRMYARLGWRYVVLMFVFVVIAGFAHTALTVVVLMRFVGGSVGTVAAVFGVAAACVALGLAMAMALAWRDARPAVSWIRGGRGPAGATAAWGASKGLVERGIPRGLAIVSVTVLPAVAYAVWREHLGAGWVPVIWLCVQLSFGGIGAYLIFTGETLLRPVVADAARFVASGLRPSRSRIGIRLKLLVSLAVSIAYAALTVSAFQGGGVHGPTRLLLSVALIVCVTLVLGVPLIVSITDAVVRPVQELVKGTERVASDDLHTLVPVTANDELGLLTASFNDMVDRLRHHEVEMRESRARIVAAADAARRRVERDLHDGAQQQLVLLQLQLGLLERELRNDPTIAARVSELRLGLDRSLAELRDLAHGIYPAVLENEGLPGALREAAHRAAIPTELECDGAGRYPAELEAAVYFCCLEGLQNAAKHAGEHARARVTLTPRDDQLTFEVADDGHGFVVTAERGSSGVQNMADRIGALGGNLRIDSTPGQGTRLQGTIPLPT